MKIKRIFWPYILFFTSIILVILANLLFKPAPWIIALTFLTVVFVPGFALSQLLKIHFLKDNLGQLTLWFSLGLIFNLLICLVAVLLGLNIKILVPFLTIANLMIFLISFCFDLKRPENNEESFSINFKTIFAPKNIIYLFLGLLVLMVLMVVDQLGTNFVGDPMYHLSIMRKVVEGQPLTMGNLSYVRNQYHIAYGIPVWHVFLSFLSQITQTNIFVFYREIPMVLTSLVFLVWYWFFLKILPNRNVAVLALFLFILYYFQNNGYIYTRLAVPDTVNSLLLMPLCFGLAIKYIFNKESNLKHLIVLSVMLAFMGLIHWTQYFYYLLGLGLFAVLFVIFKYRENDFGTVFKKILLAIFANMILAIPLLIFMQAKTRVVSQNMETFASVQKGSNNDRFYKFPPYVQLAYVMLPLIGVFFRKYRRLIFLLAIFLAGPLVFNIPSVYSLLRYYLSHVFVNRFYGALGQWPYVIWALVLGFLLVLIDRLISKADSSLKYLRYLIDGLLGLFFIWMVWAQFRTKEIENWYLAIFSDSTHNWLNANYHWLVPVVALITLLVFIAQRYYRPVLDFFEFEEYKNSSMMLILTLIIVFFFSIPAQGHLRKYIVKEFQNWHFSREATDPTFDIIDPDKFGGMETIDFIKNNIPSKSVFDTNTFASYTLPTLVDVHMASYTLGSEPTKKYKDLYNVNVPIEKKLSMLKEGNIDYLIYQYKPGESQSPYDLYPQYFTKIYESTAAIYRVNKEQVQLDLGV